MSPRVRLVKWLGSWHLTTGKDQKVAIWVQIDEAVPVHGGRIVVVWMSKAEAEAHIRELQSLVKAMGDQG